MSLAGSSSIKREDIELIADRFDEIFRKRREKRVRAIRDSAEVIQRHLETWAESLRGQLTEELQAWNQHGSPPSFVQVAGQSHLEKPFNRLLAWLTDPDAEHGLGNAFLMRLAERVGLCKMAEDLQNGEQPDIRAEEAVEDDESGKEPDLMARTSRAALLLENKVWAQESGEQFGPYLDLFTRWAGPDRETRAILCSRTSREVPKGWSSAILHSELARILYEIAHSEPGATTWGKISAVVCAVALEDSTFNERVREARAVLDETKAGSVTPRQINRLRRVLPLPQPPTPWIATGTRDE